MMLMFNVEKEVGSMYKVGTKFSSEPRNGYKDVREIVGKELNCYVIRNTRYPEFDARGERRKMWDEQFHDLVQKGDFIILN